MQVSELIQNDLHDMLKKFMNEKGIEKYETKITGGTELGDNFLADVIFVKVTSAENGKVYHLVMKTAKRSEEFRNSISAGVAYDREIHAYSVVFSEFEKLIQETNCNLKMDFVPKLYWKESQMMHETLFLENMKSKGYRLWNKTTPWNLDQSLKAMETYGKFHGLSFALKKWKPLVFKRITKDLANVRGEIVKRTDIAKFYKDLCANNVSVLRKAGKKDLAEKFIEFHIGCVDLMTGNAVEEDRLVMCHGDCWNNNFMFKFEDDRAEKICMLDFQLLTLDSPVKDLSFNIYVTCDKASLDNFELLIETYYRSMSDTVKAFGCNLEDSFTFEDLIKHLNKYAKYGLVQATFIIKLCLASKAEVIDLEQESKNGKDLVGAFTFDISNESEYHRRLICILEHYADRFM